MLRKFSNRLPALRITDRPKVPSLAEVEESKLSNQPETNSKTPKKQTLIPVGGRTKYGWWIESPISLVCYGLNLSCIWTLPAAAMTNGGVAFLIPYCVLTVLFGVSYYMMQLTLGQYSSKGAISFWHCVPIGRGIGVATVVTTLIIAFYYCVVLSWTLRYLLLSFSQPTPWRSCVDAESEFQPWASPVCLPFESPCTNESSLCNPHGFTAVLDDNYKYGIKNRWLQLTFPAEQYFHNHILELSDGIDEGGGIVILNFVSYFFIMLTVWLVCFGGTRTLGKACVVLCPIMITLGIAVLIRACIEPGAEHGILLYLQPNWDMLGSVKTWGEAGVTAFFTVLPSWGAVTTIGSFNRFDCNMHRHALFSVFAVLICSLLFGLMGAAMTGILSRITTLNNDASWFVTNGGGMVFVLAAQALSTLEQPWIIFFYIFIALLTFTTLCWLTETIAVSIGDLVPKNRQTTLFLARTILIAVLILLGLAGTSRAGYYVLILLEGYTWKMTVMVYALVEIVLISWAYGTDKLLSHVLQMNSSKQVRFIWYPLWNFVVPLLVLLFLVYTWYTAIALDGWQFAQKYGDYALPEWTKAIGYLIMIGPLLFIPLCAVIPLVKGSAGSIEERRKALLLPHSKWHPEGQPAEDDDSSTVVDAADLPVEPGKWAQSASLQVDSVTQLESASQPHSHLQMLPLPQLPPLSQLPPLPLPQSSEDPHVVQTNVDDREKVNTDEDEKEQNLSTVSDIGSIAVAGQTAEGEEKSKNRNENSRQRSRKEKELPSDTERDQPRGVILPPIDRRILRIHSSDDEMAVPPPLGGELKRAFKLPALTDLLPDRR